MYYLSYDNTPMTSWRGMSLKFRRSGIPSDAAWSKTSP